MTSEHVERVARLRELELTLPDPRSLATDNERAPFYARAAEISTTIRTRYQQWSG